MDNKSFPINIHVTEQQFFLRLASYSQQVKIYEDEVAQGLARSLIPEDQLQAQANRNSKTSPECSFRDLLLLELLKWFKLDFFRWFNAPTCDSCNSEMTHNGNLNPSADEASFGASRVEGYECVSCQSVSRFPRYNDPTKLLLTRRGRCGEWANCFTLCARALGYDARFVVDWTDHVWTECYSESQKRCDLLHLLHTARSSSHWHFGLAKRSDFILLHCDPCENVCDKPLMYERGWGKKLNYVFAFSNNEIADVVWRYTTDHAAVLARRLECREWSLLHYLRRTNELLQVFLSTERKREILERHVSELIELLSPRLQIKEGETSGRISGDLAWRRCRGELGANASSTSENNSAAPFIFCPSVAELQRKALTIYYCAVENSYFRGDAESLQGFDKAYLNDWSLATFEYSNLFHKTELDWKKAYLARRHSGEIGRVVWKFSLKDLDAKFGNVFVRFSAYAIESGIVSVKLVDCESELAVSLQTDGTLQEIAQFTGARELAIVALLDGGRGETAWQHAQLFRRSITEKSSPENAPFFVKIMFT